MKIHPHLSFNGHCKEAFTLCAEALNRTVTTMSTFGESPTRERMPREQHGLLLHAGIEPEPGRMLLGADAPPDRHAASTGTSVTISTDSVDETRTVFARLADGAQIVEPLARTFRSAQSGMLVDRFGTPWMLDCRQAPT